MLPRHDDPVGRALQNLPHPVVEASGRSVQGPVDLPPVQPTPADTGQRLRVETQARPGGKPGLQCGLTVLMGEQ